MTRTIVSQLTPICLLALASLGFTYYNESGRVLISFQDQLAELTRSAADQRQEQDTVNFDCPLEPCHLNIVFMGDSITRYMYISLVHFLRFDNTWIRPDDNPNMVVAQTYLEEYEMHTHWMHYYQQSMAQLAPYENCDCFRAPWSEKKPICENRYFYDPTRNNTITYIQAFGKKELPHGHWLDPVQAAREPAKLSETELIDVIYESHNRSNSTNRVPIVGPMPDAIPDIWIGSWEDVIESHVAKIQPDILILNAGKWPNDFHLPEPRESLKNATQRSGIPRVIWKTTTANINFRYTPGEKHVDDAMCGIFECFNISHWTAMIPHHFYHDKCHFYEPVYRKMNEQLFQFLGTNVSNAPLVDWRELGINASAVESLLRR